MTSPGSDAVTVTAHFGGGGWLFYVRVHWREGFFAVLVEGAAAVLDASDLGGIGDGCGYNGFR